jgi:hypothetical protein
MDTEKTKTRPKPRERLVYVRWGTIALTIVLVFVFFAFFAKQYQSTSLKVSLGEDRTISVETVALQSSPAAQIDPATHYIDSARGFSFKTPDPGTWSKPQIYRGLEETMKARGVTLDPNLAEAMRLTAGANPLYGLMSTAEMLMVQAGTPMKIEFTDETTTEQLDTLLARMKKSFEQQGLPWDPKEGKGILRHSLFVNSLEFPNAFAVTVFEKNKFIETGNRPTLPNFFAAFAQQLSGGALDKLAAEENSILAATALTIKRARINGREADAQLDRWILFTHNQNNFFLAEITYSPQSNAPMRVWEELRTLIESFRVTMI